MSALFSILEIDPQYGLYKEQSRRVAQPAQAEIAVNESSARAQAEDTSKVWVVR